MAAPSHPVGSWRILTLGLALALPLPAGAVQFETLALTGQPLAGRSEPLAFFFASAPDLNADRAAFWALEQSGQQVVWSATPGTAGQAIAATGQPAPGLGGSFDNLFLPAVAGDGRVAFWSDLDDGQEVLWQWQSGSGLSPLALSGTVAPGTGATFLTFFDPQPLTSGQAAFWAVTDDLEEGLWRGSGPGDLTLVARSGQPAPGAGGAFRALSDPLTAGGPLALVADLGDGREGIWQDAPTGLTAVAYSGQVAPGTGSTFDLFFDPAGEAGLPAPGGDGSLAFWTQLADDRQSLWQQTAAGDLVRLALAGEAAPGTAGTFQFLHTPAVNDRGEAVFLSTLSDFSQGLWRTGSGGLLPVALEGQTVVGGTLAAFSRVLLDEAGGIVFEAATQGGERGIWRYDPLLDLVDPILQTGQWLEVAAGDLRRVADLSLSALGDGGQLAFWAGFDDGEQGLFLAAVPGPASWLLLLTGLGLLGRRLALAPQRCQPLYFHAF